MRQELKTARRSEVRWGSSNKETRRFLVHAHTREDRRSDGPREDMRAICGGWPCDGGGCKCKCTSVQSVEVCVCVSVYVLDRRRDARCRAWTAQAIVAAPFYLRSLGLACLDGFHA